MKHRMNTRSRLVSRSFVECFSLLALLVFWSVGMSQEVSAAVLYPIGDRPIAVSAPANADRWDIDDQVDAETVDRQTVLSLTTSPADLVRALAISYHELTAVGWRSIFEVDHEAWGFTFALTLQGRPGHGPLLLSIGPVKLTSSSPIMPLASSPSSVLLFLPGLVGLLGVLLREQHRLTASGSETELLGEPPPFGSTPGLLILSADPTFSQVIQAQVSQAGYPSRIVADINDTFTISEHAVPALLLVDRRVPDWDMLRTSPVLKSVPMISLAPAGSLCTEEQWMSDLERGADSIYDFCDGGRLFLAKLRASLRRAGCAVTNRAVYQVGALHLDADHHEVTIAGQQLPLSSKPFAILKTLMEAPSRVFSRSELVDRVWGPQFAIGQHTLDVHVHALRRQLDLVPQRRCQLITIKGVGFKLKAENAMPVSCAVEVERSIHLGDRNTSEELPAASGLRAKQVSGDSLCQLPSPHVPPLKRVARRRPNRMPRRPTAVGHFGHAVLAS